MDSINFYKKNYLKTIETVKNLINSLKQLETEIKTNRKEIKEHLISFNKDIVGNLNIDFEDYVKQNKKEESENKYKNNVEEIEKEFIKEIDLIVEELIKGEKKNTETIEEESTEIKESVEEKDNNGKNKKEQKDDNKLVEPVFESVVIDLDQIPDKPKRGKRSKWRL